MKSVGTLSQFLQWRTTAQNVQANTWFVCRQSALVQTTDTSPVTGLAVATASARGTALPCLVYQSDEAVRQLIEHVTMAGPDLTIPSDDQLTSYQFWRVACAEQCQLLNEKLAGDRTFYALDSWTDPALYRQSGNTVAADPLAVSDNTADCSERRFIVVMLADDQLKPSPCHRLLADLAGMDDYGFLQRLQKCFNIRVARDAADATPQAAREFGLYVAGYWYQLRLIEGTWFHADPVSDLDVSVVHDNMMTPMLGITGAETHEGNRRLAYSSADCTVPALQQQVDAGVWQALWLMPAPDVAQLMAISDLGRLMPAHAVCFPVLFEHAVVTRAVVDNFGLADVLTSAAFR